MSKRYFYTDPLAAAWMAEHFGMTLKWKDPYSDREGFSQYSVLFCHHVVDRDDCEKIPSKYYIHPDSEYILEPQIGDLISINYQIGTVDTIDGNTITISTTCCDCLGGINLDKLQCIFQRDNISFMWPEVEDESS